MNSFPTTRELKLRARHTMAGAFGHCVTAAFLLTMAGFLLTELLRRSGGAIEMYFWPTDTSDIQSSLSLSVEGLFAALRVEEAGMGISVVITPAMLVKVFGLQLLAAALIAPLRLGAYGQLWAVRRGKPKATLSLFGAYADLRRAGQAVVLEVVLTAIQLVLQGLLLIPAVLLLGDVGVTMAGVSAVMWTALLGLVLAWCLMTPFVPARYLLARYEHATAGQALAGAFVLLRGVTGRYLRFRLSFAVWELCSALSNGVLDLYLFPYRGMAAIVWIEAREEEMRGRL